MSDQTTSQMEDEVKITIKWSGEEFHIRKIDEDETVLSLKEKIQELTGVRPERQKLLNLKFKGKPAQDNDMITKLELKQGFKIMMIGSREEDIAEVRQVPENMPEVINDLDIEEDEVEIANTENFFAGLKIHNKVESYKVNELNPLREGKKLLVLDIDYTLFDHRSVAESGIQLMRPYLHEFLTSAYRNYDIVIWSATSMKWIIQKMKLLGVSNHPDYKIAFHLDCLAMISVNTSKYGLVDCKPLGVIWGKYKQFSAKNTIMFDDIRRNFIMNPQSGLKIKPFKQAHFNRHKDRELLKLARYLDAIALLEDFQPLDHSRWEDYRSKRSKSNRRNEKSDTTHGHHA